MKKLSHLEFHNFRLVARKNYLKTELESKTDELDSFTLTILKWYLLPPLLISGAIYSIVYVRHESIYSWLIESAVNGVYCFGFIAMLPQLFINYKLKSVAHLPWRAFITDQSSFGNVQRRYHFLDLSLPKMAISNRSEQIYRAEFRKSIVR
ncbi:hypothetical protein QR98_0056490 [Sarcoptes scabiei]|uniref:Lipid scramblase CLPTM1L n=1 Tax=Sarcoptes scabiei TaxID=52283 RepID=A0A132A862_SARSC|nr:hypothetical protein QR98_0056490 [Sarcoptes scabiei]